MCGAATSDEPGGRKGIRAARDIGDAVHQGQQELFDPGQGAMCGLELLRDVNGALKPNRPQVVDLGELRGRGKEAAIDCVRISIDQVGSGLDPEHDVDDLAALRSMRLERVAIAGSHEHKLPGLQSLVNAVDPMRRLTAFDQEHLKKIVIMRLGGKSACQELSGEMKRLIIANIAPHVKRLMLHRTRLAMKFGAEQQKYQSSVQKDQVTLLRSGPVVATL